MKVLEINKNSIKVETPAGPCLVARYDDGNGPFFLNEKLEKEYAVIELETAKPATQDEAKTYTFIVEYWHGDTVRRRESKAVATNPHIAAQKVLSNYKNPIEIEEI